MWIYKRADRPDQLVHKHLVDPLKVACPPISTPPLSIYLYVHHHRPWAGFGMTVLNRQEQTILSLLLYPHLHLFHQSSPHHVLSTTKLDKLGSIPRSLSRYKPRLIQHPQSLLLAVIVNPATPPSSINLPPHHPDSTLPTPP